MGVKTQFFFTPTLTFQLPCYYRPTPQGECQRCSSLVLVLINLISTRTRLEHRRHSQSLTRNPSLQLSMQLLTHFPSSMRNPSLHLVQCSALKHCTVSWARHTLCRVQHHCTGAASRIQRRDDSNAFGAGKSCKQ